MAQTAFFMGGAKTPRTGMYKLGLVERTLMVAVKERRPAPRRREHLGVRSRFLNLPHLATARTLPHSSFTLPACRGVARTFRKFGTRHSKCSTSVAIRQARPTAARNRPRSSVFLARKNILISRTAPRRGSRRSSTRLHKFIPPDKRIPAGGSTPPRHACRTPIHHLVQGAPASEAAF